MSNTTQAMPVKGHVGKIVLPQANQPSSPVETGKAKKIVESHFENKGALRSPRNDEIDMSKRSSIDLRIKQNHENMELADKTFWATLETIQSALKEIIVFKKTAKKGDSFEKYTNELNKHSIALNVAEKDREYQSELSKRLPILKKAKEVVTKLLEVRTTFRDVYNSSELKRLYNQLYYARPVIAKYNKMIDQRLPEFNGQIEAKKEDFTKQVERKNKLFGEIIEKRSDELKKTINLTQFDLEINFLIEEKKIENPNLSEVEIDKIREDELKKRVDLKLDALKKSELEKLNGDEFKSLEKAFLIELQNKAMEEYESKDPELKKARKDVEDITKKFKEFEVQYKEIQTQVRAVYTEVFTEKKRIDGMIQKPHYPIDDSTKEILTMLSQDCGEVYCPKPALIEAETKKNTRGEEDSYFKLNLKTNISNIKQYMGNVDADFARIISYIAPEGHGIPVTVSFDRKYYLLNGVI